MSLPERAPQVGAPLVAHPDIDHITFTGSVATGMQVMRSAADHVTRLILELGGKSPLVVLADCDIDAALNGVIEAIYENAGQICSAGSRLILDQAHCRRIPEPPCRAGQKLQDRPRPDQPRYWAGQFPEATQDIDAHVKRAVASGNHVHLGGAIANSETTGNGWFYQPTIIAAQGLADPLVQEEIFGPVLTVQIVDTSR